MRSDSDKRKSDVPTRRVLGSKQDVRNALIDVARSARRSIAIFTHDLEPSVYGSIDFVDTIKNLMLTQKSARVRILLKDPARCLHDGHRLIEFARRFSSFIEIRLANEDFAAHNEAFLIADRSALVYRANASRHEGISDLDSARIAQRYLDVFNMIWEKSSVASELRALHI